MEFKNTDEFIDFDQLEALILLEQVIEDYTKSENFSAAVHKELLDIYYNYAEEIGLLEV